MKKLLLSTAVVAILAFSGTAQAATIDDAVAEAEVVAPLTFSKTDNLNFGSFAAGVGGTVVVAADNTVTYTGTDGTSAAPTATSGKFTIGGDTTQAYIFTPTTGDTLLLKKDGNSTTDTMTATLTVTNATGTVGTDNPVVHGSLNVASSQTPGSYSTVYTATAYYN